MTSHSQREETLRRSIVAAIMTAAIFVLAARSSAQDSNFTWVGPFPGYWSVPIYWDPNGPPDSSHSALIGQGECIIDGNTQAQCFNLYLAGGELKQTGQLLVDGNVYAGYGNNSGVFSQTDGNSYIGLSLFIGQGLQQNKSGSFTATRGTVVVAGDVWVGDPTAGPNQGTALATLTISGGGEANKAVLKIGGSIHICQMPGLQTSFSSSAHFAGELGSLDPCSALWIFNDGGLYFGESNYSYTLGRILSTDPNGVGTCLIEQHSRVSVNQICQVFVDIGYGGLIVNGTTESYESHIIDGVDNYDGNFRVANSKVTTGFLSTFWPDGGSGGRVWLDENGILRVAYIRQTLVSVCQSGQLFVRGGPVFVRSTLENPILDLPMWVRNIENDGNVHLSNCSLEIWDSIRGVGGGVSGWTILDSNVLLTVNNNVQQGYVTIVDSAELLVNHLDGKDSNIAYGIENAGDLEIGGGTLYSPYVVGIDGDVAGRTWIDGDGNLVTGRIVQESVYIGDNAALTLVDGGETYEPNARTNVYSTGLVHVMSGEHVLGKVVSPEPNTCLGTIVLEPNTILHVTGFRTASVAIGPGAKLIIEGNLDGSPTTSQTNHLIIANQGDPDSNLIVWEGTLDIKNCSLVIHDTDANFVRSMVRSGFNGGGEYDMDGLRGGAGGGRRFAPMDPNGLLFPAVDPSLRVPILDPNYRALLLDPNTRRVPVDANLLLPPGWNRPVPVQDQYWVMTRPAGLGPRPVYGNTAVRTNSPVLRPSPFTVAWNQPPRRRPQYPPPDEASSRAASSTLVILALGAMALLAIWHPRLHGPGKPSPRRKAGRSRSAPSRPRQRRLDHGRGGNHR